MKKNLLTILLKQTPKEIFQNFIPKEKPCWDITNM
jgi:hypothetical protein